MHVTGNTAVSSHYKSEERSMQNRHRAQRWAGHKATGPLSTSAAAVYVCANLIYYKTKWLCSESRGDNCSVEKAL